MIPVCLYFQVHQPYRLRRYNYFDVGRERRYFDDEKNGELLGRVSEKCYLPATAMLLRLLERHPRFAVSFSLSGCLLQQLRDFAPAVRENFQRLAATGRVEFLAETSHHSLAWLKSREEFEAQVELHRRRIVEDFGLEPRVFRNTELIYSDELALYLEEKNYRGVLADGVEPLLGGRSPHHVYRAATSKGLPLLLRDYRMSDDIAFRFSNRQWKEWPLTAEKYDRWVSGLSGEILSLFMDFETFGEHQWKETGIFQFFEAWVDRALTRPDARFLTPSQAIETLPARDVLSAPRLISWADEARDLSAWQGNELQRDALQRLFSLETRVKASGSEELLRDFRRLTTSDHFYYIATKSYADADVHAYFSPYESPYEAYMALMHILSDLERRLSRPRPLSAAVRPRA
ncbi:MAG TPA: glycoside hydrolase family 57 protein [Thermoanaerobaculia bacterium]|nr:glycoside hydrolase family 57 protein [Thermoanaerobaculia bacterium]